MATSGHEVPYQVSNAVNNQDHGLIVAVTAAVLLVLSALFFLLRLWVRWPWKALFEHDDICVCVAQLFGLVQTIVVLAAVPQGLGKRPHLLSPAQQKNVERLIYASDLLYLVAVWLSRLSLVLVYLRLSSNRKRAKSVRRFACVVSAFAAASILIVAIRQNSLEPWTEGLSATTFYRWIAVGVLGDAVEVILVIAAVELVWNLHMARTAKMTVASGFAVRLIVLISMILRLVSLHSNVNSEDFSYAFTTPELWTQLDLHLCLICATIPCLRIFLKGLNTGYYGVAIEQLAPTGTVMATKGDSYNMSTFRSHGSECKKQDIGNPTQPQTSKAGKTTSRITNERPEEDVSIHSQSSDKKIYVQQTVNVAYD